MFKYLSIHKCIDKFDEIAFLFFMSKSSRITSFKGASEAAQSIRDLISRVANSTATVLITGESGTGKELVARALHDESNRAGANFVPINCTAIPKELIESELFGHRKGAFTGAMNDRIGRFELAHGGTIFLDEIGDLSMDMQVKLLRVLQERTVDPVGGHKPVHVDVRVVAATHCDLEAQIVAGRFREDLYYRLNVLPLQTPALRQRPEDVPELLTHFSRNSIQNGAQPISFTDDFLDALQAYTWPGNVRELSNLVDRFSTFFAGQHLSLGNVPADLLPKGLAKLQAERCAYPATSLKRVVPKPPKVTSIYSAVKSSLLDELEDNPVEDIIMLAQGMSCLPAEGLSLKDRLADIERDLIIQALARTNGNVSQTARMLNLQRTTLIEKLNKYDLRQGVLNVSSG